MLHLGLLLLRPRSVTPARSPFPAWPSHSRSSCSRDSGEQAVEEADDHRRPEISRQSEEQPAEHVGRQADQKDGLAAKQVREDAAEAERSRGGGGRGGRVQGSPH